MKTSKNYKKANRTSSNLSEEKLMELRRILPEAFSESRIDWDKLRAVLGSAIDERIEKFSFTWAGKSNAIKNVLIPSKSTLRPAKDESVMFDESENIFIEGDNLEVLKLLQKTYFEKVKMIYIDPPYNTGGDFVYRDDFSAPLSNYLKQTGQKDGNGSSLTTNRETSGRYHSDWLSMMYPRLKLAWNFLRDDGVIFVSIDDNEVHHLRMVMNEIFGEENFVAMLVVQTNPRGRSLDRHFAKTLEYILVYGKDAQKQGVIYNVAKSDNALAEYDQEDNDGKYRLLELRNRNPVFTRANRPNLYYPIYVNPKTGNVSLEQTKEFTEKALPLNSHSEDGCWTWGKAKVENGKSLLIGKKVSTGVWRVYRKDYIPEDGATTKEKTLWIDSSVNHEYGREEVARLFETSGSNIPFDFPKSVELIRKIVQVATQPKENHIVLDFFGGSGTTAHAVIAQNAEDKGNRRWVCIQLPEKTDPASQAHKSGYKTIADIAKERVRRAIKAVVEEKISENNGYYNGLREVYGYKEREIKELQSDAVSYLDDGFKVFKLGESTYPENQFEFDPEKSEGENKKAFESYLAKAKQAKLLDDTDDLDVVYENIVKEGFSLNSRIAEIKIGKNKVYTVTDGERQLLVCLDKKLDEKTISELASKDYKSKVFICLDNALNDSAKANLGLNVELKTI